jgi:hypothetical protein
MDTVGFAAKSTDTPRLVESKSPVGDALLCTVLDVVAAACDNACLRKCLSNEDDARQLQTALVEQLSNTRVSAYDARITDHLRPALVAWARHADADVRALNYDVLLLTRASKPRVRLAAVRVCGALLGALGGGGAQTLLAETAPFLAELFEGG